MTTKQPDPMENTENGRPHGGRRCTATSRTAMQCRKPAIPGGEVCATHGGSAPQVREAAQKRLALVEAQHAVATLGLRRDISPSDALLEEVQRTAGTVEWLRDKVQGLAERELVWGTTKEVTEADGVTTTTEEAAPSVWYRLLLEERKHLVVVCSAALKAGVAERAIRIAEEQAVLLAQAVRGILADLHLSPEQQALVSTVVPHHLRAAAATAGGDDD